MTSKNIVEKQETFEAGIKTWQDMEDGTIAACDNIIAATDNLLLTTVAGIIKADSQKHKMVLDVIRQALDGMISLTPEELGQMSALLDKHIELEQSSVAMASAQLELSKNFVVNHLVSYLLEDEKKHVLLLNQLNDYKKHLYPYA